MQPLAQLPLDAFIKGLNVQVVEFANSVRLLAAIADPVRYRALKELAAGTCLSPMQLA